MKLIKWFRFEDKKLILVPSVDGIEYFRNKLPELRVDKGSNLRLSESTELLAGKEAIAFCAELPGEIKHLGAEQNIVKNTFEMRIFTDEGLNYFLITPLALSKA